MRNTYETRLAIIRKNLALQDEKILKLRTDYITNKPLIGNEKAFIGTYKALQSQQTAAKFKNQSRSKERAAEVAANKEMGIETRKSSPVKGAAGASRGGQLNKKEREIMGLTTGAVYGKETEE